MDAKTKKTIRARVEELHPDKVIVHRDDSVELRWGFFYTHGRTTEGYVKAVSEKIPEAIISKDYNETRENWQPWPKDSYFKVTFRLPQSHPG